MFHWPGPELAQDKQRSIPIKEKKKEENLHYVCIAFLSTVTDGRPEATVRKSTGVVHTVPPKHQHSS